MFAQKRAIEEALVSRGWVVTPSCAGGRGTTITACQESFCITVYSGSYRSAWQALARDIEKQIGEPLLPIQPLAIASTPAI
jgi:hypothetical protein